MQGIYLIHRDFAKHCISIALPRLQEQHTRRQTVYRYHIVRVADCMGSEQSSADFIKVNLDGVIALLQSEAEAFPRGIGVDLKRMCRKALRRARGQW